MKKFMIDDIPAVLYGEPSNELILFVHGKDGCKEEAAALEAVTDCQILAVDLPGHGKRTDTERLVPWEVVPELRRVMEYASGWKRISLYAHSIGAWFSMQSFAGMKLEKCYFVSPILDMEKLINNMMQWANVSEERLKAEKIIKTDFGQDLSWEYLTFARGHRIKKWSAPTEILYAGRDNLTDRDTVERFCKQFNCKLTVMEHGEHWFHTPEQLGVLRGWQRIVIDR